MYDETASYNRWLRGPGSRVHSSGDAFHAGWEAATPQLVPYRREFEEWYLELNADFGKPELSWVNETRSYFYTATQGLYELYAALMETRDLWINSDAADVCLTALHEKVG